MREEKMAEITRSGSCARVCLQTDVEYEGADRLRHILENLIVEGCVTIVIDFGACRFLDSSGLGTLVTLHKRLKTMGGDLSLTNVPDDIQDLLVITRVNKYISIV